MKNETITTAVIYNKNGKELKRYTSSAEDSEWVAMYWGYEYDNAALKAKLISQYKSMSMALKDIENTDISEIKKIDAQLKKEEEKRKREEEKRKKEKKVQIEKQRKALAKRREKLEKYFNKHEVEAILKNQIYRGMSEMALIESWGKPQRINESIGSWGVHKQYVYYGGDYVYVENGEITSYSLSR